MKFRENFSAEDDARLTPCEDDKLKVAEISPFQAGSDYLLSVKRPTLNQKCRVFFCYLSINPYFIFTLSSLSIIGSDINHRKKAVDTEWTISRGSPETYESISISAVGFD